MPIHVFWTKYFKLERKLPWMECSHSRMCEYALWNADSEYIPWWCLLWLEWKILLMRNGFENWKADSQFSPGACGMRNRGREYLGPWCILIWLAEFLRNEQSKNVHTFHFPAAPQLHSYNGFRLTEKPEISSMNKIHSMVDNYEISFQYILGPMMAFKFCRLFTYDTKSSKSPT